MFWPQSQLVKWWILTTKSIYESINCIIDMKSAGTLSIHVCTFLICCVLNRKKAIMTLYNCCFDLYLITNTAVPPLSSQTLSCTPPISSLSLPVSFPHYIAEMSDSIPAVWFWALLSYLPLFTFLMSSSSSSCFLCSRIRWPCPVPTPACLPARGYRRLPKSRKRRCVINRAKGRPCGRFPLHCHL